MNILNNIKDHKQKEQKLILEFKQWVTDKNIPLDERWCAFTDSDLGEHDVWVQHFDFGEFNSGYRNVIEDYLYSDREKYYTFDVDELYELLLEPYEKSPKQRYDRITNSWIDIDGEYNEYGCLDRPWRINIPLPWPSYNDDGSSKKLTPEEQEAYEKAQKESYKIVVFTQEHADNFREQCLKLFLKSFDYYW